MQLTDVVSDILALPEWAPKLILLILVVGFIPALIMAWDFFRDDERFNELIRPLNLEEALH